MRFPPLLGRRILRSLLFHLNPIGTGSPSRFPPRMTRPPRLEHLSPRGSTRMMMVPLERASPFTRPGCGLPKHARSAAVGKQRLVIYSINPALSGSNETNSVTENHHANDARTEAWSANTLASAECADRTKSQARTVIRKKIPSTPLADHRFLHRFFLPLTNTPICIFPFPFSSLIVCIEDSAPDKLAKDNIGTNNRHRLHLFTNRITSPNPLV